MPAEWDLISELGLRRLQICLDDPFVLAVHEYRLSLDPEYVLKGFIPVYQHIAGAGAHEDLDPHELVPEALGDIFIYLPGIGVGRPYVEAVVAPAGLMGPMDLVLKGIHRDGRWICVRHIHE
jgi:hypothetical protein